MLTTKDFPKLTDDLQSIFNEVASRKVAQSVGLTIYDVADTDRLNHEELILHGIAGIRKLAEGEDFPKVLTNEGDSIIWTQQAYGAMVSITKKMRMFGLYNQMDTVIRSLAEDAFDKIDQSLADRLLGGFSTTYTDPYGDTVSTLGPDGLQLFHASHTNNVTSETFRNICLEGDTPNPPLTRKAIVDTRVAALTHKDPNNILRPINLDTLVVGPGLEDTAMRIVGSQYLPGSANNDINPLYNKVKVVVWPRLNSNSAGTDTSDYWYLYDSTAVKESLKCLFAERPSLDAPEEVYENKDWQYTLDFYYTIGTGYPAYIWGSNGTGS